MDDRLGPRERLIHQIEEQIESGVYRPEDRIPSIRQLCERYHTSQRSAISALNALVKRGLLRRKPRSGFYVNMPGTNATEEATAAEADTKSSRPAAFLAFSAQTPSPFYQGAQDCLRERGIDLRFFCHEEAILPQPADTFCGAIVVAGLSQADRFFEVLSRLSMPVVQIGRSLSDSVDSVWTDEEAGGRRAVERLAEAGYRSIAFGTATDLETKDPSFRRRRLGAELAVAKCGVSYDLLLSRNNWWGAKEDEIRVLDWVRSRTPDRLPACLLLSNGFLIEQVASILYRHDMVDRADLSVAAFSDNDAAAPIPLPLRVAHPVHDLGRLAAIRLLNRLREEDLPLSISLVPPLVHEDFPVHNINSS